MLDRVGVCAVVSASDGGGEEMLDGLLGNLLSYHHFITTLPNNLLNLEISSVRKAHSLLT